MLTPTNPGAVAPSVGLSGFPALLVQRGLIGQSDLAAAQSRAVRDQIELADAVVVFGVTEGASYAALAAAAGAEAIALEGVASSELAVRLVPERLARRHLIVPLQVDNRTLTYATCRPFNAEAEADLGFASGRRTLLKVATRSAVVAALELCYPKAQPMDTLTERVRAETPLAAGAPGSGDGNAILEMCQMIIVRALDSGASDVQIDCGPAGTAIRCRVGTALQPLLTVPIDVLPNLRDRFKLLARVGSAVRNRPQSGTFQITVNGRTIDVRLSTQPTPAGDTIVMRVADRDRRAAAAALAAEQAKRHGRLRVLIAEDEPITRLLVKVLLERERYEVLVATNGQEALDIAAKERPNLVLIDLMMPVMDGYEAIGRLRREFPMSALPIIVLTAEDGNSVERRVLELGADDYIIKPFEPDILMSRVNAVFRRLNLVVAA